jgi:hypothetical protein
MFFFNILTVIEKQSESHIFFFIENQVNDINIKQQTPLSIGNYRYKFVFFF